MAEIVTVRLIVVDDKFFTRSKSGTVWGTIYFKIANGFFPDNGWTDMVVPFSCAWLEALIRIANGSTSKEKVRFMDGPFSLDLLANSAGLVEIRFAHKDMLQHSAKTEIDDLLENAISVGEQLRMSCKQRGWPDDDSDTTALAIATKQASEVFQKLKRSRTPRCNPKQHLIS